MDVQNALIVNPPEIPKSLDEACKNLTDKPTKEAGTTFADLWYLVFGGISERAEKKRLQVTKNIADYKAELYAAVNAIPVERRQEPKLQIAGPALQKSQYCVEEEELREMFVKLISRSMDKKYSSKIRPSFSEIISQMTPLDAQNLALFYGTGHALLPLCEYRVLTVNPGYKTVQTNVFLHNPEINNIRIQASSIAELSQLGLVLISYDVGLADNTAYNIFEQHPFFVSLKQHVDQELEESYKLPENSNKLKGVEVKKGSAQLTPLGSDFLEVCLVQGQA